MRIPVHSFGYHGVERRRRTPHLVLIVVDEDCHVRFSFCDGADGDETARLLCDERGQLRADVKSIVSSFLAHHSSSLPMRTHVIQIDEQRAVRVSPLLGHEETLFALIVETHAKNDLISKAAARYQLTRRQTEVLSLLLGGATAGEVATRLSISEYTVQGYIKALLSKTSSRNRSAMVAKVLEWNGAPHDEQREPADSRLEPAERARTSKVFG